MTEHATSSTSRQCKYGYTRDEIEALVGDRIDAFNHWMRGQTGSICDGQLYDHDKREYYPSGCGPHGPVVYEHDVRQFLRGGRPLD